MKIIRVMPTTRSQAQDLVEQPNTEVAQVDLAQQQQPSSSTFGIIIPKLNGRNYLNWSSLIKDVILLRGFDRVIFQDDGNMLMKVQARAFLESHLDEEHFSAVRSNETPKAIWDHLSRMCLGVNSCDVALLVTRFYSYQYCSGDSMPTHLEKLQAMRGQLESINQGPTDEVFMDRILQTLPLEYSKLKENWDYLHLSQKTVSEMHSRILKIEDDLRHSEPLPSAFIINGHKKSRNNRYARKGLECERCGRNGHLVRDCRTRPENFLKAQDKPPQSSSKKQDEAPQSDQGSTQREKVVMMTASIDPDTALAATDSTSSILLNQWFIDSAATQHICNKKHWFTTLRACETVQYVRVGDNGLSRIHGIESIEVTCNVSGEQVEATIEDVLYLPEMVSNLLSTGRLMSKGISIHFSGETVELSLGEKIIARGTALESNLCLMDIRAMKASQEIATSVKQSEAWRIGTRLSATPIKERLVKLLNDPEIGISANDISTSIDYSTCM